jgi:hypothetical protein
VNHAESLESVLLQSWATLYRFGHGRESRMYSADADQVAQVLKQFGPVPLIRKETCSPVVVPFVKSQMAGS